MRILNALLVITFCKFLISCSQVPSSISNDHIYPAYEENFVLKKVFFTSQGNSFVDYYLRNTFIFNSQQYYARVRVYNKTDVDTAYFRNSQEGLVYVDTENLIETLDLPKEPKVGKKWKEPSNWVYEVKSINATLETPSKTFTNLVEIEATQTTGETKEKFIKYNNFYSKENGYVGSVANGGLFAYLVESIRIGHPQKE